MSSSNDIVVVKLGGSAGSDVALFCADVAELVKSGRRLVVVHGGSDRTNVLQERLGTPAQFITSPSGHTSRRTDRATLEIMQMAVRGGLNQLVVETLQARGVNAVGLSGVDGRLWVGARKEAVRSVENGRTRIIRDDFTGTVEQVNTALITMLLDAGYVPVLCPPGLSTGNEPINVDADRAAAKTAAALGAGQLLLLSNVAGLMRAFPDESTLIARIERANVEEAMNFAEGRMKKKVLGAGEALGGGVRRVVIGDARIERPISAALSGKGTVFE